MPGSITISFRTLVSAVALALAVVAAYFVGAVGSDGDANASAPVAGRAIKDGTAEAPVIVMTGIGKAQGVPDQLAFDVTVTITDSDVSSALQRASNTMRDVLHA